MARIDRFPRVSESTLRQVVLHMVHNEPRYKILLDKAWEAAIAKPRVAATRRVGAVRRKKRWTEQSRVSGAPLNVAVGISQAWEA